MIFLDNASTTRVFDEVLGTMSDIDREYFYNPSALYGNSLKVKELLESARHTIAATLNAEKGELVFTSCATESNNWILNCGFKNKKGNVVISAGEHPSVYNVAMYLKGKGLDVRVARVTSDGILDMDDLQKKLDLETSLVSVIHCSNETGMINDIESISKIVRKKSPKALIHSDGVQAFCKLKTDVKKMDVDFYTISAHKICGPKGCGAVYISKKNKIAPLIYGGGQENGLRSGTENTSGIVGFAAAVMAFAKRYNVAKTREIFDYLRDSLTKEGWTYNGAFDKASCLAIGREGGEYNGQNAERDNWQNGDVSAGLYKSKAKPVTCEKYGNSGFILSLSYRGIRSEVLQHMLSDEGVLIGLGSACSSKSSENRVLSAMGCDKESIEGSIRLSISPLTTLDDAKIAVTKINNALNALKGKMRI